MIARRSELPGGGVWMSAPHEKLPRVVIRPKIKIALLMLIFRILFLGLANVSKYLGSRGISYTIPVCLTVIVGR